MKEGDFAGKYFCKWLKYQLFNVREISNGIITGLPLTSSCIAEITW